MGYSTINYEVQDGILTITLNRPDQLNAFTVQMADDLEAAFIRASAEDEVKAIVVTGAGRAFCAGMDLAGTGDNVFGLDESQHPTLQDLSERFDEPEIRGGVRDIAGRVTLAIFDCTKPVIGALNGAAVGVGITMTMGMDVRLASENARIGFVFGKLGITAEGCATWFLPRLVGMSQALEWVYSADVISAEEAQRGGLVKAVYPADELLDAAYALARKFTTNRSPVATALMRQMMYRNSAQPDPVQAHCVESLAMFYASQADGKEGVRAFLEKRQPVFATKTSTDMPPFYPWFQR